MKTDVNSMEGGSELFKSVKERCASCLSKGVGYNPILDESFEVDDPVEVDLEPEPEPDLEPEPEPEPDPDTIITKDEEKYANDLLMKMHHIYRLPEDKLLEIKKRYTDLGFEPFSPIYDADLNPGGRGLSIPRDAKNKYSNKELRKQKLKLSKIKHTDKGATSHIPLAELNASYDYLVNDEVNPFHVDRYKYKPKEESEEEAGEQTAEQRESAEAAAEQRADQQRAKEEGRAGVDESVEFEPEPESSQEEIELLIKPHILGELKIGYDHNTMVIIRLIGIHAKTGLKVGQKIVRVRDPNKENDEYNDEYNDRDQNTMIQRLDMNYGFQKLDETPTTVPITVVEPTSENKNKKRKKKKKKSGTPSCCGCHSLGTRNKKGFSGKAPEQSKGGLKAQNNKKKQTKRRRKKATKIKNKKTKKYHRKKGKTNKR